MRRVIDKYKHIPITAKATLWFTICNLLLKGISLITVPLFARLMSDEQYGLLSIFMSYEQLFMIFATWEIQMGAYQKGIFNYRDNIPTFTSATIGLCNLISTVFYGILLLAHRWIYNYTHMSVTILIMLYFFTIVRPSMNCWTIRERTKYEYRRVVGITLLYSIVTVIVPLMAILLIDNSAETKFIYTLIAGIIVSLFFYLKDFKPGVLLKNKVETKQYWRFLIKFEAPLVLHSLSYLVLSQSDRVMIGSMVGNAQAAYYSVAYSIASVVNIFQSAVNQTLLPWRYQKLENKEYNEISNITNVLLIIFGAGILLFILVAPEVIKFLFPASYFEAIWCIVPVSVSVYFMFLYTIFVNIETYYEKTKYVMYVSVASSIINIILNYIGIKTIGYVACAYTTLISYIIFAIGHYAFMKKVLRDEASGASVADGRKVLWISLSLLIASAVVILLYKHTFIRYILLCVTLFVLVVKRKQITSLVRLLKETKS